MRKKIALYDIDYTLIPFDSFFYLVINSIKHRPFNILKIPFITLYTFLLLFKIITLTQYKEKWLILYKGYTQDEIDTISKDFVDKYIIPKIKKEVVKNIKENRENGCLIVFATASFEFYFKYLAEYLDADYFIGTKTFIKDGIFTGKIEGMNCKGIEKIHRLRNLMNNVEIDIDNSISYTDSLTDLPFLELTKEMQLIHKKKWKIIKTFTK